MLATVRKEKDSVELEAACQNTMQSSILNKNYTRCIKYDVTHEMLQVWDTPYNFMSKRSWSFQLKGLASRKPRGTLLPYWFSLKKRGKQAGWCPDIKWGKSRKMPGFYNLFYIGLHCSFNHILVLWYGHKNRFLMAFPGKGAREWLKDLLSLWGR